MPYRGLSLPLKNSFWIMQRKGWLRMIEQIREETSKALTELLEVAKLRKGDIVVVGCSSSF